MMSAVKTIFYKEMRRVLFDKKNLVPEDILNEEKPVFFAFTPFYLRDKTLGYIAYEPESIKGESDFLKIYLPIC